MTNELLRCFSVPISLFALTTLPAQDWNLRTPTPSPAAATLPRMAFDTARGRAVLFGGWDAPVGNIVFQDTWEWDGTTWTQRAPAFVPTERESHVMAYDLQRGRTVMWGGQDFNFNLLTETLEWDGTNWQNRNPANSPPGRLLAGMCYDLTRGVCVLFGGDDGTNLLADTWEWNGTNWAQVTTAAAPAGRISPAMAFDVSRARTVLFGGDDFTNVLDDTWEYDGTNWTQLLTDGAPPGRVDAGMAYDNARSRLVLFGGADLLIDRNDTWEFAGGRWHQVMTATTPVGNAAMAMVYDPARAQTVVFGGFDGTAALRGTNEYGGNAATYRTFGRGCPGSNGRDPVLAALTLPRLGQVLNLQISELPITGGAGFMLTALSDVSWNGNPLPFELTPFGVPGCNAYTSAEVSTFVTNVNGVASFSVAVPNNPVLAGVIVFHQGVSLDPTVLRPVGITVSNAGEATLR
ncbi:MAG: hypothetical protein IPK26_30970 [Planctomycetes bacterium]|nr:hypothetical protein [Planctomycetota bacterium]